MPPLASGMGRRLLWLAGFVFALTALAQARSSWVDPDTPVVQWTLGTLAGGLFFLWTPYLLLGRRIAARRLVPTAVLTGAGTLVLRIGSTIAMPAYISHDTERYGLVGFTFAVVSWLFAASLVIVGRRRSARCWTGARAGRRTSRRRRTTSTDSSDRGDAVLPGRGKLRP